MKNKFTPAYAIDDEITCPFCKLPIQIHYHLEENGLVITWDSEEKPNE